MRFCIHCGTDIANGAIFCSACGKSVASTVGSPTDNARGAYWQRNSGELLADEVLREPAVAEDLAKSVVHGQTIDHLERLAKEGPVNNPEVDEAIKLAGLFTEPPLPLQAYVFAKDARLQLEKRWFPPGVERPSASLILDDYRIFVRTELFDFLRRTTVLEGTAYKSLVPYEGLRYWLAWCTLALLIHHQLLAGVEEPPRERDLTLLIERYGLSFVESAISAGMPEK
jgi:hypothetical protein